MQWSWLPFASTAVASAACVLGSSLILFPFNTEKLLCISMALSSGILLSAIFSDLLPTALELLQESVWVSWRPDLVVLGLFVAGAAGVQSISALILYMNPSFSGCACHEPGRHVEAAAAATTTGTGGTSAADAERSVTAAEVGEGANACPDDCGICIDDRHLEHTMRRMSNDVQPPPPPPPPLAPMPTTERTPLLKSPRAAITPSDLENGTGHHHHHHHQGLHHQHDDHSDAGSATATYEDARSFRVLAIQTAIAIVIHKLPEGLITFTSSSHSPGMGVMLTLAIALHNVPEGVAIAMPVLVATQSRVKSFLTAAALGGLTQPLGAFLGYALVEWSSIEHEALFGCTFAAASGVLAMLVAKGMLPMAYRLDKYGKRVWKWLLVGIFCGVIGSVSGV
ncbi:Zinc transporter [Sorochytrium milnesiophthora]